MSRGHTHSVDAAIERRHRERDGEERFVNLAIDFVLETDERVLMATGGRWDRRLDDYDGDAEVGVVVRVHPGQSRAVEWFVKWLDAHEDRRDSPPSLATFDAETFELDADPEHAYAALFAGGRRAGKTWLAVALMVAYAIRFPRAIVWIASPNDQKHDEIRRYLQGAIADEWLDRQTISEYEFCNGSMIYLKSAHDPELLKEGKANIIMLNEGQMMKQRAFVIARGAVVDNSGLVLVCANPPVDVKDQMWVSDFAADAAAGRRAAVYLEFNPLLNPHIDRGALLAMKAELDERTFAIEVLGQFRGPRDAVAYNWIRLDNERPVPPDYLDVTDSFLVNLEGPGVTHIVGLDVQRFPYIGGPWYKLFVPPGVTPTHDNVLAWIVGETVLEGGDEIDFCAELSEAGLDPSATLIVCDASGRYQHSRRRAADSPPNDWKGRGSFDLIRGEGWRRIVPPDRRMKRNPELVDRARAFTSMICSGMGVRRLFADPLKAPKTCAAIRDWRTKNGLPSRSQEVAHLGDGTSYPIVRLFPRRLRPGAGSEKHTRVGDPVASRVDNVIAMPARDSSRIVPQQRGRGSRTRGM